MRKVFLPLLTICLVFGIQMRTFSQSQDITVQELENHTGYLASDDLGGRLPGTENDRQAAAYIAGEYKKAGIELLGEEGFQYFDVVTSVRAGKNNVYKSGEIEGRVSKDFIPMSFSKNTSLEAEVVFVGYGFQVENDTLKWDDYENVDVEGKWVLILRGEPGEENPGSPFSATVGLREKVLTAKDNGAGGVLFVSGPTFDKEDALMRMFYDKTTSDAGVPVFHIKRKLADQLIEMPVSSIEDSIQKTMVHISFNSKTVLFAQSDVVHKKVRTMNVVGMIEGSDPKLKNEIIVLGAHYDHLGMGGPGSGSRVPDTTAIHNGADDNASGVAGIIEIAEMIAAKREILGRSVVVVAFGAEEMGLIGSKQFVENPIIDMDQVVKAKSDDGNDQEL